MIIWEREIGFNLIEQIERETYNISEEKKEILEHYHLYM